MFSHFASHAHFHESRIYITSPSRHQTWWTKTFTNESGSNQLRSFYSSKKTLTHVANYQQCGSMCSGVLKSHQFKLSKWKKINSHEFYYYLFFIVLFIELFVLPLLKLNWFRGSYLKLPKGFVNNFMRFITWPDRSSSIYEQEEPQIEK